MYTFKNILLIIFFCLLSFQPYAQESVQDNYFEISKNMEIFNALFKELNIYYVDQIQPGKLLKTGTDAMLKELDPYTTYITEEDIEDYRFQMTGKYGGIGSTIRKVKDYLAISEPYENSPVVKAGLKAGDLILEIDGKSTKGKEVDDISTLLKGSPGSTVKLKIKDPITNTESLKTITREEIQVSSVPYACMLGPQQDIAYVKMTQFTDRCTYYVKAALDSLKKANPGMRSLVLDLRYNPGGLLEEAVNMCNLFLNTGQLVVSTRGKNTEWDKTYVTKNSAWDDKMPLVVLINKNSASASEIVSGTLQDLDRGVVIGQRSFGKGLVQTTRNLAFNAKLKVTTAKYYTPSGRCIQALDYSHRNEDGSVGAVADSLKSKFKTKAGRVVMDGGGIEPDISTQAKENLQIISTLITKSYAFDYATQYVAKNPSIANPKEFKLSDADFNNFVTWLDGKDYSYNTKAEEALLKFKETAEKESYFEGVKNDFEKLQKALSVDKKQDLLKHKTEVLRLLQDEIVTRYYFLKGRIQNQLNEDIDIAEAIQILSDASKYKKLLGQG
ncbi:MAG: S41 family peptidase [Chitinophagaceae bacterium]